MSKNLSIIVPGRCDCNCEFCTSKYLEYPYFNEYFRKFVDFITNGVPNDVDSVSLTGGEPTLSPFLPAILPMIKRSEKINKVVLTTNGSKVLSPENIDFIRTYVDHINISRHAIGTENNAIIFKNKNIITDAQIKVFSNIMNKRGIDVTLNHVYTKTNNHDLDYLLKYIDYAKYLNATGVCFRFDHRENYISKTDLEEKVAVLFKSTYAYKCPVCIVNNYLINGMHVAFKTSHEEPSNDIEDIFEYIYQTDNTLTSDWTGKKTLTVLSNPLLKVNGEIFKSNPHAISFDSDYDDSCNGANSLGGRFGGDLGGGC